jgi:hypothetical protein
MRPLVGAGGALVPAGPDQAVAAPEQKPIPASGAVFGSFAAVGGLPSASSRRWKIRFEPRLVVDQRALRPARIRRPQYEEIRLVFDKASRLAPYLVEIDDDPVLRCRRIERGPCDTVVRRRRPAGDHLRGDWLAPCATAKPGTAGILMLSAVTAVLVGDSRNTARRRCCALGDPLFECGEHARKAGVALCGLRGLVALRLSVKAGRRLPQL